MWGASNNVSYPKRITDYTTTLKKDPDVRASAPSLPRTLNTHAHFFYAFNRLATTDIKSSSKVFRVRPRDLKAIMVVNECSYDINALSIPTMGSSATILRRFFSSPFV